jgi:hypothetical protein
MPIKPSKVFGSLVGPTPSFSEYTHRGIVGPDFIKIIDDTLDEGFAFYFGEPTGSTVAVDSGPNGYHADYVDEGLTPEGLTQLGRGPFNNRFTASANSTFVSGQTQVRAFIPTTDGLLTSDLKPRGPGTLVLITCHDGENFPCHFNMSDNFGQSGLRVIQGRNYWDIYSGFSNFGAENRITVSGDYGNPANYEASGKVNQAQMLTVAISAGGEANVWVNDLLAETRNPWTVTPTTGTLFRLDMKSDFNGNSRGGIIQAAVWLTDFVADQAWVSELWAGALQTEVNTIAEVPNIQSYPAGLTEITKLDFSSEVLLHHVFNGRVILDPDRKSIDGTVPGSVEPALSPQYIKNGNPTWFETTLNDTYPGTRSYLNRGGQYDANALHGAFATSGTFFLEYTGTAGLERRHKIPYFGHQIATGNTLYLDVDAYEYPNGVKGNLLPAYTGNTFGGPFATGGGSFGALDADNLYIGKIGASGGYFDDILLEAQPGQSGGLINPRISDFITALIDVGESDFVIDCIWDSKGIPFAEASLSIVFRWVDNFNFLYFISTSTGGEIRKVVAGVDSQVASYNSFGAVSGSRLRRSRLCCKNSKIYAWAWDYAYEVGVNPDYSGAGIIASNEPQFSTATYVGFAAKGTTGFVGEGITPRIFTFTVTRPQGL